jgi:PEP-CTERM motif
LVQSKIEELRMNFRASKIAMLVAVFALATSVAGFAQLPCGVANQITCQPWDGGSNLFASQNDTTGGNGNFATTYQQFTLPKGPIYWDVESFHWVGGYFNPPAQGAITAWTLTLYNDAGGVPGGAIAAGSFPGTGGETFIANVGGFPIYVYWLYFQSFDMLPGTYWASVVPDLGFPPQWGWATSTGADPGYQCFFGTCGPAGVGFAYAVDGRPIPEPGTLIMLGTGILGLAGSLRRKLL